MTAKKQQTVTAIYKKESGRLRNFLRRILPSAEDAEDILQDVFYSLSRQEALETIDQISGWLFRVARNKIADRYRKHKPITFSDLEPDEEMLDFTISAFPVSSADPLEQLFADALTEAIDEALDIMPPDQREVYIKHELEGISFKKLSADLGVPVNTLLSRKRYAVLFLRNELKHFYKDLNT